MRPLNRPMFKMGGPVKEGIMDGIKEPQATFGVGNNAIKDGDTVTDIEIEMKYSF